MTSRPTSAGLAAWESLLRFHRAATAGLGGELREVFGFGLDEYDILYQLSRGGSDGMRMSDLTDATLIARSSCSRLVDELVRAALLERHPDHHDRRAVRVRLTPAGRRITRRAGAVHIRGIRRYIDGRLASRDVNELARILGKLSSPGRGHAGADVPKAPSSSRAKARARS